MKHKLLVLGAIALMTGSCCQKSDIDTKVDELYAQMPMEERVAQLRSTYMDELFDSLGVLDTTKCKELIPYGIGHFSQYASQQPLDANTLRDRVAAIQDWLMHHTPNGNSDSFLENYSCILPKLLLLYRRPCHLLR